MGESPPSTGITDMPPTGVAAMSEGTMQGKITEALAQEFRLLAGGRLCEASDGATLPTYNPATGELLANVPNARPRDIDAAIDAAHRARLAWREAGYTTRRQLVLKLAEMLRENAELFGLLDTLDTGNI